MTTKTFVPKPTFAQDRKVSFENIKYGMLVEVLDNNDGGYHSGCKVHFFNRKGVLVGNYYEFMPYERLRLRKQNTKEEAKKWKTSISRDYQRFFYGKRFEKIKTSLFIPILNICSALIRFTQKYMD